MKIMYADTINGVFDMTMEEVLQIVKDNPFFTRPDDVCYTGNDLLKMARLKNEWHK